MTYRRFAPHPALSHLVEYLWVQESLECCDDVPPTTVLPVGRMELLVHFWEPFLRLTDDRGQEMPMSFVLGQRTRPIKVRASGRTGLIIVGFQPWAGEALLRGGAVEIVDDAVPLRSLNRGLGARSLAERVEDAGSIEGRVAVVEDFLLRALAGQDPDPLAIAAVGRLEECGGKLAIRDLVRELGISRRQLHRRFSRAVGIGPKRFSRLVRFQRAVGLLRSGRDWPEAVDRCGFVDQAHLIREIKAFSGRTPRELQSRPTTPLMRAYNSRPDSGVYDTIYL